MCGIVGMILTEPLTNADRQRLNKALHSIEHRGPDAQGTYFCENVGFAHARLSILDLSAAGDQPMTSSNGRYTIVFNGEIYNYKELIHEFQLSGLNSHSDTEVLLEAISSQGPSVFKRLNGMFAFAILDNVLKRIWLVRDQLGIKPLYTVRKNGNLYFGSEIKALRELDPSLDQVNFEALSEWSYYGTTHGEQTLFRDVQRLLPGHYLEIFTSSLDARIEEYWSPKPAPTNLNGKDLVAQTRNLLDNAVRRQVVSDVPVGVFLSGGIDSSALTAFASKHYDGKLSTYSVGFDYEKGVNELAKARRVARAFGTEHHELHVKASDMADEIATLVHCHDQPFSDAANLPLYLLGKQVRETSKVILQGDGGDELFGGYKRYRTLARLKRMQIAAYAGGVANVLTHKNAEHYRRQRYIDAIKARPLSKVMALLLTVESTRFTPMQIFSKEIQNTIKYDPFRRYTEVAEKFAGLPPAELMFIMDSMIILPDVFFEKVDRATMRTSIEVRVPFMDLDLVEFCHSLSAKQKIPGGIQKYLLKKALDGIVADEVLYGPKTGFGVPVSYWLSKPLKELFFDTMRSFTQKSPGVLDVTAIDQLYTLHHSGKRDVGFLLWKVLNLMLWSDINRVNWKGGL